MADLAHREAQPDDLSAEVLSYVSEPIARYANRDCQGLVAVGDEVNDGCFHPPCATRRQDKYIGNTLVL